jgi:rubrerythrin
MEFWWIKLQGGPMDERLKEAFHKTYEGEAKAALRLKIFAKKAEQEDLPQMAKLFRVIVFSEEIHGERALRMLRERHRYQSQRELPVGNQYCGSGLRQFY